MAGYGDRWVFKRPGCSGVVSGGDCLRVVRGGCYVPVGVPWRGVKRGQFCGEKTSKPAHIKDYQLGSLNTNSAV
jgi:hypothetical protein